MKVGLIGGGFQHAYSSTLWKKPTFFEWSKNKVESITFFIDNSIKSGINCNCERKFGWLVESRDITPGAIDYVKENHRLLSESYEIIFTHNKDIYELEPNFIYLPPHGYWIGEPKMHKKSKLVSMISSNKKMSIGHTNRLKYVEKFRNQVDLFGRGFNPIESKEEALNDYMFSITIENDSYETYWSEKILDCFATGTIPIYYGAPDIGEYFDMNGIIILDENFDISTLTPELYNSKLDSIKYNYEKALNYNVIEDIIYTKYLTWK